MILQTHKIEHLYFVKNPYRRDLDSFCTSQQELISLLDNNTLSYNPIVYEVHFWLAVPKFKKLSLAAVKKIKKETLSENCFKANKSTKEKPIERQNKRELLAANYKKKSSAASKVLKLMDQDFSYQQALKTVLNQDKRLNRKKLETELNTYI